MYIYAVCCRSIEIKLYFSNKKIALDIKTEFENIFKDNSNIIEDVNRIVSSIIKESDTVSLNPQVIEEKKLDFVLATCRFIIQLATNFIISPELRFKKLVPNSRFTEEEISSSNFNISKIDLNYNTHEVSIHATCKSSITHQVLATLSDDLHQLLNKLNYSLDQFYLSILRVKLYVKNSGYQGNHFEFKTQINTVISMFMGEELYGDKFVFIREMIQNARDAVLTRLTHEKSSNITFTPKIELKYDEEKKEFICFDNGIGMNKGTVNRYLSDIGRSFYRSEDYHKLIGGRVDDISSPISRFGIGLLSYFLVSNKIIIRTKKKDDIGYKIEIPSRGAFFFLTEDSSINFIGTEVTLELKKKLSWTRNSVKQSMNNLDYDILLKIDGDQEFSPTNKIPKYKSYFIENGNWKPIRAISYYILNANFDITFHHGKTSYLITQYRLLRALKNKKRPCILEYNRSFLKFAITQGNSYSHDFQVISSGGIYVPKVKDFNLKNLNLPDWGNYVIEISPSRVRMNLARDTMLSYNFSNEELEDIWKVVSKNLREYFLSIEMSFESYFIPREEKTPYKFYSNKPFLFYELMNLPNDKQHFIIEILMQKYTVFLFRFTNNTIECRYENIKSLSKFLDEEFEELSYSSNKFLEKITTNWIVLNNNYDLLGSLSNLETPSVKTKQKHFNLDLMQDNFSRITGFKIFPKRKNNLLKKVFKSINTITYNIQKEIFQLKANRPIKIKEGRLLSLVKEYNAKADELKELFQLRIEMKESEKKE